MKNRKERNKDIIERMKKGEALNHGIEAGDTWWQPRPIIKKDEKAMEMIFMKHQEDIIRDMESSFAICKTCNGQGWIPCHCGGGSNNGCADCFGDGFHGCPDCKEEDE